MDKQVKHELQLQQLVDGSLSHSERSNLLRSLGNDSPVWRELALAFVQKQILDESLGKPETFLIEEPEVTLRPNHATSSRGWTYLAIVASLLLGLWLGSFFENSTNSPIANQPEIAQKNLDPSSSEIQNNQIMLADALARSVRPVSLDARRAFLKAGYVLDEQEKIADVQLPTGDLIQLPIRQFNVRYLGNAAFQ